jgi:phage regulator Rha-like protein
LLNEDQAFFLLSLSRNTDRVVELKASLIMAFREARYGNACRSLEARKKEASSSGRRLAHWRYDKPGVYAHVAHLREQLKLPLDSEDFRP